MCCKNFMQCLQRKTYYKPCLAVLLGILEEGSSGTYAAKEALEVAETAHREGTNLRDLSIVAL